MSLSGVLNRELARESEPEYQQQPSYSSVELELDELAA
jgi:hypothetical protein